MPGSLHSWTDDQLTEAVATTRSWRGVLRHLGLCPTSTSALRLVRQHVTRLGLDTAHFTGQRTWSDAALKQAAARAQSWGELLAALGIGARYGNDRTRIKAHALRLGVDLSHLDAQALETVHPVAAPPELKNLREAATAIAAAWFSLRGHNSALPVEPAVHDLLVSMPDGIKRVQVKTTTYNSSRGWMVSVGRRPYSIGNRERLIPYDPELIDLFFIMDGDLNIYLLPSQVIAGRVGILLRTYEKYIVGNALGLMTPAPCHAA